jgi:hypothetical protein
MAMAQRGKRSREGVSNIDETIDQVSGEKSSPPLSRGKRARYTNIRLPARIAPLFFELIRESERDLATRSRSYYIPAGSSLNFL